MSHKSGCTAVFYKGRAYACSCGLKTCHRCSNALPAGRPILVCDRCLRNGRSQQEHERIVSLVKGATK